MPWEEAVRILLGVVKNLDLVAEIELGLGTDGKTVASLRIKCNAHVEGK